MVKFDFEVPSSDMRWRNAHLDPPEPDTDVLGLFHFWDSANQTMHGVLHQCCFLRGNEDDEDDEEEDGVGWVLLMGYENSHNGPTMHTVPCPAPTFWCELVWPSASLSAGKFANSSLPSQN